MERPRDDRDDEEGAAEDWRDDDQGAAEDWRDDEFDDPAALEDDDEGNVFGPRPDEGWEEILPGQPEPENVLFVLLGMVTTLALVADLVGLF